MASPEGVTPQDNDVIISVYNFRSGFGIMGTTTTALVGSVYKIGSSVYNVTVSQKVGFLRTEAFFATDAGETFIAISKDDILITYEDIPPP